MNAAPFPRAVLLTGVTGSLGGHLCAELLARTRATVYCLTRGAAQRTTGRLADLGLASGERIVHVSGDIAQPRLGLSPAAYDALAESVDEILHCAAHVNLAAGYDHLAPVNVGGTRGIIAFAERAARLAHRTVPIRFVSTLATLATARDTGLTEVDERTPPSAETAGALGYAQTKVTAERELRAAADRGVPVTVFRPGVVTGHSETGRTETSDILVPLLRSSIALGCMPTGASLPVDAVDVVARALVQLCLNQGTETKTFHLIHPEPLPMGDVHEALHRNGYRLDMVEGEQWQSRVDDRADDPAVLPQAAMRDLSSYVFTTGPRCRVPRMRSDLTWRTLADVGVARPPLDGPYLDRVIRSLVADRALPLAHAVGAVN
ncbi:thioester reductase domain-containing protein [Streptomyces turgidiscabies]|uniref:Thioester reductase-like protein n=1 Tax=Streptomyces turgidiscabies TaxID=85558 RepID=A0ABU0RXS8_9ACTN|nr:thioester reductase domain-containing protein [Streptomyces turgidiscabies]MDQ0935700.1 thioester reductase-like protein [Streptomyces turgidiscabies]